MLEDGRRWIRFLAGRGAALGFGIGVVSGFGWYNKEVERIEYDKSQGGGMLESWMI